MEFVVGIDACRIRSGGGIAHLLGILKEGDPAQYGITRVHVWSHKLLLKALPQAEWLVKINPPQLQDSLAHQAIWQLRNLSKEAQSAECDILFTADASTLCRYRPSVVLSQDMQSYESGVMKHYGLSAKRLRLQMIGILQTMSMRRADGVIFLTQYAKKTIERSTGKLANVAIIPHGINAEFNCINSDRKWPDSGKAIQCVYISNAAMYKHQWDVVRAFAKLRKTGLNVHLLLVGGGSGRAKKLTDEAIAEADPLGEFIQCKEFVPHEEISGILAASNLCVFASSCENMPVALMEAMAAGLPIACSDRGPMPEVLDDGGIFFNPEECDSIADAIERIVKDPLLRIKIARRAKELSRQYSWARCANETWAFIAETYKRLAA
jgi:glycosyltransferase involved in cell wall biosynthesis